MSTSPALQAERLSVERDGRRVLDGVTFTVERGEVFALLGGNGAGKSTTLLAFLGLLTPVSGAARVLGHVAHVAATTVRTQLAYLPEQAAVYGHLSARENLAYFTSLAGTPASTAEIEAGLDVVGLAVEHRARATSGYSKGMRQKVAIALAVLRRCPVLLLDEPTSGLDPLAIDEFHQLVATLASDGVTTLMVTHDVYGACKVARRIGLLRQGRLVAHFDATAQGDIDPEAVHRAFVQQGPA